MDKVEGGAEGEAATPAAKVTCYCGSSFKLSYGGFKVAKSEECIITKNAKAATTVFIFKNLLRHYA